MAKGKQNKNQNQAEQTPAADKPAQQTEKAAPAEKKEKKSKGKQQKA